MQLKFKLFFKKLILPFLGLLYLLTLNACQYNKNINTHKSLNVDIAILNGMVIDGTGATRQQLDIGIKNNQIIYLGKEKNLFAKRVIDAKSLIVAPGFIDGHSHSDRFIKFNNNKLNESALFQGVTTVVGGADGQWSPLEIQSLISKYNKNGIATNIAFFVGHNGIRSAVMGNAQRHATDIEIYKMSTLVKQGMEMGAVGLSTGLMYDPGKHSSTEEVIALAKVAAKYGGVYDSHVRDPINALLASDQEVITIGREANIPAKIGHVKAVCQHNAGLSKSIISMVEQARREGINIVSDQYPYDGAKTEFLASLINVPSSITSQPNYNLKSALSNSQTLSVLKKTSEEGINGQFSWLKILAYDCIRITYSRDFPDYEGKYISELAKESKISGFDIIVKLLIDAKSPIRITFGGVEENDVQAILTKSWNMIVSDGYYVDKQSPNNIHPRSTGTFARILGYYVREKELLTLEEAIRKMTSAPAEFLNLSGRGIIKQGAIADIVIFNPETVRSQSSWSEPKHYAKGFNYVLVSGQLVIDENKLTGRTPGNYIKRTNLTQR